MTLRYNRSVATKKRKIYILKHKSQGRESVRRPDARACLSSTWIKWNRRGEVSRRNPGKEENRDRNIEEETKTG